jgi:pimeloyl-ACP methyl ester carboxylesterase
VEGIAADGVAQVVIGIPASTVGEQFSLSIDSSLCPTQNSNDCGLLFDPSTPPSNLFGNPSPSSISVSAVQTELGPMAFAAYRAPVDFVRQGNSSDPQAAQRFVTIDMTPAIPNGTTLGLPIEIVRPPVTLIHGNWSDASSWDAFLQPLFGPSPPTRGYEGSLRFYFDRIDYSETLVTLGIRGSVPGAVFQLNGINSAFRDLARVAAAESDIVGYSMGGLLARAIANDSATPSAFAYGQGGIHKMISLDTPHLGSPFATNFSTLPLCQDLFARNGLHSGQNIADLAPRSKILSNLSAQSLTAKHIPTHAITGIASDSQTEATEQCYNASIFVPGVSNVIACTVVHEACMSLLPSGGFNQLMNGSSDLIVPLDSESAKGLQISGSGPIPVSAPNSAGVAVIHAVAPPLFPMGPDILGRDVVQGVVGPSAQGPGNIITNHVLDLLNTPVTDNTTFGLITP